MPVSSMHFRSSGIVIICSSFIFLTYFQNKLITQVKFIKILIPTMAISKYHIKLCPEGKEDVLKTIKNYYLSDLNMDLEEFGAKSGSSRHFPRFCTSLISNLNVIFYLNFAYLMDNSFFIEFEECDTLYRAYQRIDPAI